MASPADHLPSGARNLPLDAPDADPGYRVRTVALQRTPPLHRIERRAPLGHAFLECVIAGRGWFAAGEGAETELAPGSLFCYGFDTGHRYGSPRRSPMETLWIRFSGSGARDRLVAAMGSDATTARPRTVVEILPLFLDAYRAALDPGPDQERICQAYLAIILGKLTADRTRTQAGSDYDRYLRCRDLLDRQATSLRSIHPVCLREGVGSSYLSRLFRRFDSESPHAYLCRRKLEQAAQRLLDTSEPVAAIATAVGYGDPFHFSRSFKARFGISPQRYRNGR